MKIDIVTIFPSMFDSPFRESIVQRAQEAGKVKLRVYDLRKWTNDQHKTVDDRPFGGGAGMIMKVEPIYRALMSLDADHTGYRVLLTAKGERIIQKKVRELSQKEYVILICGHYEGVDHRVHEYLVDECLSIGNFILTGGEIPAMAVTDAIVRLIPGVLGNEDSLQEESFSQSDRAQQTIYIEYPQYTRPAVFQTCEGKVLKVPDILISGDHKQIQKWRDEHRREA